MLLRVTERKDCILHKVKLIWAIALPIVIQGIVFQLQALTDKAFLGKMEAKYISALGAAQFPFGTSVDAFIALSVGLVIITAQFVGAKKKEEINSYVISSMGYGSVITTLLFLMWFFLAKQILTVFRVDPVIINDSTLYIKICSGALLILGVECALEAMLQGMGRTKPTMICSIMKVALNIMISYVLIYGKFGFPEMKIKGAAVGTLIANVISSMGLILYCLVIKKKEFQLHKNIWKNIKRSNYKKVVKIGLPTALEYFLWNASNLVLIAFLNGLSYTATGIYTLTFGIEVVVYAVYNGIGKACMTLIGQGIGAKNEKATSIYVKICIVMDIILVAMTLIVFTVANQPILRIFTEDKTMIESARNYLIMTAIIMFPKSMNSIFGNGIRAHGNTKWMLYTQIIGSIFVISFSFFMVKIVGLGIIAIYLTLLFDETIRAIINGIQIRKYIS